MRAVLVTTGLLMALLGVTAPAAVAQCANPIACENQLPGADPSTWEIDGAGDPSIQGYATAMSVNKGQAISFKIKSATPNYRIDILRLGYYGGDGARLMQGNLSPTGTSTQPACQTDASSGLIDCGNWAVSRTWTVPATAVSGVYIAHLVRNDTGGESHIPFVVRDDASTSDAVLQTSDTTWQAYNTYGGNSLYKCTVACPPGDPSTYKAAYKVSYNRPFNTEEDDSGRSGLFGGAEYSLIRFLERNGYDLSYVSGVDVHRRGELLRNHDVFISSGHDEYWSATQRTSMEAARNAGVNLAFFTGNTGFWKTRWENGDRTMVSYKDTHFPAQEDPVEWTGTWRDPRFTTPAENTPENALSGLSFLVNAGTSDIMVPFAYRNLRLWRNTAAQSLTSGQSLRLAPNTLGYEWDVDADNGYRPAGQFQLSSTTVTGLEVFTDYGSNVTTNGTATHNMTMYRAPSGARVFNSGTVQWAWGLDDFHFDGTSDRNMRQATVNLLADMRAQPATREADLSAATLSTDATAPTSTLAAPPASVADGTRITLSGTAADTGGGVVAGVEVSTDGGDSWHPATGTTSWSYSWVAHGNPTSRIRVRAVDDSGNLQTPGPGVDVAVTCPCSLFGPNITPSVADSGDPTPVEVGMKFTSEAYGTVTGIRFFKSAANTGTHTGSLWTADGQRLAQVTFTGESASGWQTATFSQPVEIQPNVTYVASYHAPNGRYAVTPAYFYRSPAPGPNGGAAPDAKPLHAVRNTNGVFGYTATSAFPAGSFDASNYWVDVTFRPEPAPGTVTGVGATEGGRTSANVSWSAPASGGKVTAYSVIPYVGAAAQPARTVSAPATSTTVTGLTTGTTYTFRVRAVNPNGSGPESAASGPVTPSGPVAPSGPTAATADAASGAARVTWNASASDGDSPITGYTVTPYDGSTALPAVQAGASATSASVPGLTNGTTYTFRVTARNAVGASPPSAPSNAVTPQSTLFGFSAPAAAAADSGDGRPVEVGVRFRADFDGTVTGVRFYKSAANTGTHVGSLWSASGIRLAQATFADETATGWQTATFSTPVAVTAGTVYTASYFAPLGHYAATAEGLLGGVDTPPLEALPGASSANGVFAYGAASTFPSSTYNGANYWVDVMYAMPKPGQVTGVSAAAGGRTSANVTWNAPSSGGPVTSYVVTPSSGPPVTASGTSATITGLTTGTTYTFRVRAVNANGAGPDSAPSGPVTPVSAVVPAAPSDVRARPASSSARVTWTGAASDGDSPITGQTVTAYAGSTAAASMTVGAAATSATVTGLDNGTAYTFRVTAQNAVGSGAPSAASNAVTPQLTLFDFAAPAVADAGDPSPVTLGVKFRSDFAGSVTGIRFHKAAGNTGTHVGALWSAAGAKLAEVTFTGESDSGWQSATFSSPVQITPGATYVASYHAPNGHYSVTSGGLSSGADNGILHAPGDANGVFAYGPSIAFPTGTYNATNYSVDVLFAPAPKPGAVGTVTATAGQRSATVSWSAPASGGPATSYTVTPSGGAPPVTVSGTSTTITGLTAGATYTFTVRASNPSGSGPESAPSNAVTALGAGAPGTPTGVSAVADTTSAVVRWTAPASDGGSAITGYRITPSSGAPVTVGAAARDARVTGLTNGTAYTFTVAATNAAGTGTASAPTSAVVPRASVLGLAAPPVADAGDGASVVLGMKFTADVDGTVTGIRFYKAPANTGTHVGTLWSAGGVRLGEATFTGETASGWQTLPLATPVAVTAGTTYVVSYLAPNGHYAATGGVFSSGPIDAPPLHAPASATTPNGVFAYSATPVFPTGSWNATSYWVDVLFAPGGST